MFSYLKAKAAGIAGYDIRYLISDILEIKY